MKKPAVIAIILTLGATFSCIPEDTPPLVIPLTDSSLTNPDFGYADFSPAHLPDEFCISKTPTGVSMFYSYSAYLDGGIVEVKFLGTHLTGETVIDNTVYQMPSIDAVYDNANNTTRLAFFYDYPNWTDQDPIMGGSFSGSNLNTFSINDKRCKKVRIAMINESVNKYVVVSLTEDYILYKLVSFTGPTSYTVSPAYNAGTSNALLLFQNGFLTQLRDIRLAYNHTTFKTLVSANFNNSSHNYFQVMDEGGIIGSAKIVNKYNDGNAPDYDIIAIGNYFLVAYSSNLNIAQQNQGNSVLTGEHVRLALINSNGDMEDLVVGTNNPDYVNVEKSIALPQLIGSSNDVGKICLTRKNNSEAGLAFVRDEKLFFTRITCNQNKLSISPILLVDEGVSSDYYTQTRIYWDGVYHIVYYNPLLFPEYPVLQVYVSI